MSNPENSVLTVVVRALRAESRGKLISCSVAPDGRIGDGRFVLQVLDVPEQNVIVIIAVDMRLLEREDLPGVVDSASDYIDDVLEDLRLHGFDEAEMGMGLWRDAIDDAFNANDDNEGESE